MAAMPALAGDRQNPYVGPDEPHATLRFTGGLKTQGLIQLYLFRVDGKHALKKGRNVVYLKPGQYKLQFRAPGLRNRGHVPDAPAIVPGSTSWRETRNTIDLEAKAGTVYSIAGKPHGNGAWTAIVWKKRGQSD